ncbi:MAG TPA: hypothetical protein PL017_03265 [Tenuifilaceae bacterium]|nr:hypothetical protein [Tenuifilaceae bacterium]HPJ45091.1 hypothetical protein [Tenuifilaceae bacterium]HPQ34484.1 hypothetical protein [Tenuifilaceae bacterium]
MKQVKFFTFFLLAGTALFMSSCTVSNRSMKTPNHHIEFYKGDFEYSPQVSAEANSVRVFGIDWQRLFSWESGTIETEASSQASQIAIGGNAVSDNGFGTVTAVIPVVGDFAKGRVSSYALHKLMEENPGYDIVIYPQYEKKTFIFPIFYSKRTVKVTARLGKIKQ